MPGAFGVSLTACRSRLGTSQWGDWPQYTRSLRTRPVYELHPPYTTCITALLRYWAT